jgi:hypothetical protein
MMSTAWTNFAGSHASTHDTTATTLMAATGELGPNWIRLPIRHLRRETAFAGVRTVRERVRVRPAKRRCGRPGPADRRARSTADQHCPESRAP